MSEFSGQGVGFKRSRRRFTPAYAMASEILFLVEKSSMGGYEINAPGFSIHTQADTWEEVREAATDAVRCHFDESDRPKFIRLHFVKEEVIAI